MSFPRFLGVLVLLLAAIGCAGWAIATGPSFFFSADDTGLHHEVTVPVFRFLALWAVSLSLALTGSRMAKPGDGPSAWRELGGLLLVAVFALGASLIFVNEYIYSFYDSKGFPVHPAEQVIFPAAGWHGLTDHFLAALLVFVGFGLLWLTSRKKSTAAGTATGDGDTNR
ncbi:MAG TPA: hypothetical protein PK961_17365 [bacterium]|nr:hypothetical protein [bacterium]